MLRTPPLTDSRQETARRKKASEAHGNEAVSQKKASGPHGNEPVFSFSCPNCHEKYEATTRNVGSRFCCFRCGNQLQVPVARNPLLSWIRDHCNARGWKGENTGFAVKCTVWVVIGVSTIIGLWCAGSRESKLQPRYEFGRPGFEAIDRLTHDPATGRPLTEQEKVKIQRDVETFFEMERNRPRNIMEKANRGWGQQ
jgi:hypothetical protein